MFEQQPQRSLAGKAEGVRRLQRIGLIVGTGMALLLAELMNGQQLATTLIA